MKTVSIRLPHESVSIHVFSDWHIGAPECNMKFIQDQLAAVDKDDVIILAGDLVDNATRSSVGDVFTATMSPTASCEKVIELLTPYKNNIIAMVSGNHENRTYKDTGLNPAMFIANGLGVRDKYDDVGIVVFLHYGRRYKDPNQSITRTLYVTHGSGSGATKGGKLNAITKFGAVLPNVDVIIGAHTHDAITCSEGYVNVDTRHDTVDMRQRWYVNGGSALEYAGYAQRFGLKPNALIQPIIYFSARGGVKVVI